MIQKVFPIALAATLAFACGDSTTDDVDTSDGTDTASGADTDGGTDTGAADATTDAIVDDASLDDTTGDVEPYFDAEQYILPNSHVNVVRRLGFSGQLEPGIAHGFDLDGTVSPPGDQDSCGHGDVMDPSGREGIDNQFATLWSAIEPIVGLQVEELLQGAINEGLVLVMAEITDFDNLENGEATFNLYRGSLDPQVGTQGLIAPDQTFYYDYSAPISTALATIVDGVLVAGPVELGIPITILDLDIILPMKNGFIRFTINDDGTFSGILGGTINIALVGDALLETGAAAETRAVLPFFENNADMNRVDGDCQDISAAFEFEGTTAFVVRDAAQE